MTRACTSGPRSLHSDIVREMGEYVAENEPRKVVVGFNKHITVQPGPVIPIHVLQA